MINKEFKNKKLLEYSNKEILEKIFLFKKELFSLRFKKKLGELNDTSQFNKVKKNLARLYTEFVKRSKMEID